MAVLAAVFFGAATPAGKWLLDQLHPFQLGGLLYLGAAIGVIPSAAKRGGLRLPRSNDRRNRRRLLGAVIAGGVVGPVLLLFGLRMASASSVSLWLNLELAATAVLGVAFFKDHLGRPGWLAVVLAMAGAALLSASEGVAGLVPGLLVALGCVFWGLDNHLTALIDGITPSQTTFWKGVVAGTVNLAIGLVVAPLEATPTVVAAALVVGMFSYGASIVLYVASAQGIGATRAQVIFASAPFFGVGLSVVLLGESLAIVHLISALLFVAAIVLFTREQHSHEHTHEELEHEHEHTHDDGHHEHEHTSLIAGRHTHRHSHESMAHSHRHWPDVHHRHDHGTDQREETEG